MNFSHRTSWQREQNRLTELLDQKRKRGETIVDLTVTNPTACGFDYPSDKILEAFVQPESLHYQPEAQGLLSAREAVTGYYAGKNVSVPPSDIFLTASTSEAYSLIFKLLCNAGESVLVPRPSYPLFEYLAQINDVALSYYNLHYAEGWFIDLQSIEDAITPETKAIVVINPHNPTGEYLKEVEYNEIITIARQHNLALIVDEVFLDFPFQDDEQKFGTTAACSDVLTFTLNGISKMIGLPQMKLGWIVVSGKVSDVHEAKERLEILNDTFLSVNTPVQLALPKLFDVGKIIQHQIIHRIIQNYQFLDEVFYQKPEPQQLKFENQHSTFSIRKSESGWYAILHVPGTMTDEEWAMYLLEHRNVYVLPGYFFDFEQEGLLVVSLLTKPEVFQEGVRRIL